MLFVARCYQSDLRNILIKLWCIATYFIPRRFGSDKNMSLDRDAWITIDRAKRHAVNRFIEDATQSRTADTTKPDALTLCVDILHQRLFTG